VSAQEVTVGDPQVEKIGRDRDRDHRRRTTGPTIVAGAITTGLSAWIDPIVRSAAIGRNGPSVATDRNGRRVPIARCAVKTKEPCQRHHEPFDEAQGRLSCGSRCCCFP
jgi:hypothetical protein